jgi:hypothetical protein
MLEHVHLNLKFSGTALEAGSMDVRDLAPALLGFGQVFDSANTILNGRPNQVGLRVHATTAGSFQIDLSLHQLANQAVDFLTSSGVTSTLNAAGLVGLVWGGIKAIQWLAGRPIDRIEAQANQVIIFVKNQHYTITLSEYKLLQDLELREAIAKTIAEPLSKHGIDEIRLSTNTFDDVVIQKEEAVFFVAPRAEGETLIDEVNVKAFSIVALTFKEDNKWRLSDGNATISVLIADREFLDKIEHGKVAFAKNDVLVCEVRIIQKQTPEGIKTDYTVLRVIDHKSAARQLVMDFKGE